VELYLHSPNKPSWRGAEGEHGQIQLSAVEWSPLSSRPL
jgi:hypothetical protein